MKAPTYDQDICSLCGCVVLDHDKHTSFHASLARLLGLEVDE